MDTATMQRWIYAPSERAAIDAVIDMATTLRARREYRATDSPVGGHEHPSRRRNMSSEIDTYDPWEAAANASAPPATFYGQITIDTWPCVLVKGQGKVPFDPGQHRAEDRRTAIDITITPLAESRAQFVIQRSIIAQSPEWYRHIWPSLKALGLNNPKQAVDRWCKLEQVPTGRKYRNRQGEEREARTIKFLALYDSEDACRAAYLAERGRQPGDDDDIPDVDDAPVVSDDRERQTARQFLETLAKQHHGDLTAIHAAVANIPLITAHYPIGSEELAQVVAAAIA
jgi:hypothetical protein